MLSLNWFVISVNDLGKKKNPRTHSFLPEGTPVCYWEEFPKSEMSLASYFLEVKSPGRKKKIIEGIQVHRTITLMNNACVFHNVP